MIDCALDFPHEWSMNNMIFYCNKLELRRKFYFATVKHEYRVRYGQNVCYISDGFV